MIRRTLLLAAMTAFIAAGTACGSGPASTPAPKLTAEQVAVFSVGRRPTQVAFGGGYAWVGNSGDGTVSQIDPTTNRLVTTFKIGDTAVRRSQGCEPYDVHGMPDGSFVTRRCDVPSAVLFAAGSLWVTRDEELVLLRIDPATRRVTQTIPLHISPFAMGAGPDSIWVTDYENGAVAHVDTRTNKLVGVIRGLAAGPAGVAVSGGSAWVVNRSQEGITRIDVASNQVQLFLPLGRGPLAVTATSDAIYVKEEIDGDIVRIDPVTNGIVARIPVGPKEGRDGVDSIALDGPSLWVTGMHLQRIDTRTNSVVQQLKQDATTVGVDRPGQVWVTNNLGDVVRVRGGGG
ncbi:MAG: Vgb family protein [Candidatus Dormibacteria bacterium]